MCTLEQEQSGYFVRVDPQYSFFHQLEFLEKIESVSAYRKTVLIGELLVALREGPRRDVDFPLAGIEDENMYLMTHADDEYLVMLYYASHEAERIVYPLCVSFYYRGCFPETDDDTSEVNSFPKPQLSEEYISKKRRREDRFRSLLLCRTPQVINRSFNSVAGGGIDQTTVALERSEVMRASVLNIVVSIGVALICEAPLAASAAAPPDPAQSDASDWGGSPTVHGGGETTITLGGGGGITGAGTILGNGEACLEVQGLSNGDGDIVDLAAVTSVATTNGAAAGVGTAAGATISGTAGAGASTPVGYTVVTIIDIDGLAQLPGGNTTIWGVTDNTTVGRSGNTFGDGGLLGVQWINGGPGSSVVVAGSGSASNSITAGGAIGVAAITGRAGDTNSLGGGTAGVDNVRVLEVMQ